MNINFVNYDECYVPDASKMMGKTWNFDKSLKNLKDKDIIYSSLFKISHLESDYCDIAVDENNNVVGFLIGGSTLDKTTLPHIKFSLGLFVNLLVGKFGNRRVALNFIKEMGKDFSTLMSIKNQYDKEIKLFFVDESSRGTGLGKTLMNRYIDNCRAKGVESIILMTDEGCNYGFYDYYGFKRVNKIHSNAFAKPELEYNGYAYAYEVK